MDVKVVGRAWVGCGEVAVCYISTLVERLVGGCWLWSVLCVCVCVFPYVWPWSWGNWFGIGWMEVKGGGCVPGLVAVQLRFEKFPL